MNFQSIFFFLSIFAQFVVGYSKISTGGKLGPEENQKRLDTCGREGLPPLSISTKPPSWFWVSYQTLPNKNKAFVSASQISPRHFLTSSTNLLSKDMKWFHNMSTFNVNCSGKVDLNVEVPTDVVKRLKLTTLHCFQNKNCTVPSWIPVKAYLLHYCDETIQQLFAVTYSPMIIELSKNSKENSVCLADRTFDAGLGQEVLSYQMDHRGALRESHGKITEEKNERFGVAGVNVTNPFTTGPLLEWSGKVWAIVGYAGSNALLNSTEGPVKFYYRTTWFENSTCSLTGICAVDPPTTGTSPARRTRPPETTVLMTTGRPTTSSSSATSKAVASTKGPITIASVQKTLPPTTMKRTGVNTVLNTMTTVRPVSTKPPSGAFTTVTSATSSTKPPPVLKTVATMAASTIGETTLQVTKPTTAKVTADPDSMTVPTVLPQNSTDEATPESNTGPSAPTDQTTHPEDPPPDDPVTYEPPLALGIDFSLGPEHSIDEPPIDYEEYEERKKHMDDDDQDHKDFGMDETGNGGREMELLLVLAGVFMRI